MEKEIYLLIGAVLGAAASLITTKINTRSQLTLARENHENKSRIEGQKLPHQQQQAVGGSAPLHRTDGSRPRTPVPRLMHPPLNHEAFVIIHLKRPAQPAATPGQPSAEMALSARETQRELAGNHPRRSRSPRRWSRYEPQPCRTVRHPPGLGVPTCPAPGGERHRAAPDEVPGDVSLERGTTPR
jgi:hypothetical protein